MKTTLLPPPPPPPPPITLPTLVPAVAAPLLREGELFDDTYRLIRLLGEGAMGAVYEATHARLAGRYAIKLLLLKPTVGSEAIALFAREARITSLLQHPNIVQVIDHNTTADGTEYLVMEYLAGESLAQRLVREGPLPSTPSSASSTRSRRGWRPPTPRASFTATSSRTTCSWCRSRDGEAESVKILDFGISKVKGTSWGRQAPEGTVMGTPLYMAPEQIEGRVADADAATDQFALAVIAYEMLTGRNPFRPTPPAGSSPWCSTAIRRRWAPGRDVELVVRRGLAKSNRQRFPTITDFSDALRAAAAGQLRETQWAATLAYAAGEVASHDSKGRSGRRMRRVVLTAGVGASIAVAFVVGGEVNRRSSPVRRTVPAEAAAGHPAAIAEHELDAHAAEAGHAREAEASDAGQVETPPGAEPGIEPAVEKAAIDSLPRAREQRSRHQRWTTSGPASPRPPTPPPRAPTVDDDGDRTRHRAVELNGRITHLD